MPADFLTNANLNRLSGPTTLDFQGAATVTTDGAGNLTVGGNHTITGNALLSNKKLGAAVAGDILDLSAAQGQLKIGPTSTTLKTSFIGDAATFIDTNANQFNSGARSTFATITATNHNHAVTTPNVVLFDQQTATATATAIGTIGATQYTPTGGVSGTYACYAMLT